MEGLEISVLNFKEVINNDFGRIDSEFFGSDFLNKEIKLKQNVVKKISELAVVTDGEHGSPDLDENSGILYLSGHNIKENYLDLDNTRRCSEKLHLKNLRSALKVDNVLMSIVGTIGRSSVVYDDVLANTDRNVATIKKIDNNLNPKFLSTFLNSSYGKYQTERFSTGNVQPLLNLLQVKSILVPLLSQDFQGKIDDIVVESKLNREQGKQIYKQAEKLLLEQLGLQDFTPSSDGINVKSLSNSFGDTGRLDAEYYQPKYDEIVEKIKSQPYVSLINIVSIKKSIEPGSKNYSEEGLPFMRVADYSKFGLTEPQKYLASDFVSENKYKIKKLKPKKGTILFSKDGSVGTAYHLREDFNGITSGAILHLKVKDESKIIPEYLTLALNSQVVQMQAERDAGGSIILHWRVSEIENVLVPVIDYIKQQEIAALVEESFALKKQSEHLFEVAKRAVEIAIEEGEDKGLEYINVNTKNLN